MAAHGGNTVSLIVNNGPFENEITEDGEMLFLNYDIDYDLACLEFKYPETLAIAELRNWDWHSFSVLIGFVENTLAREEAALIGRKWLDMTRERLGVEDFFGRSIDEIVKDIDAAVAEENRDRVDQIAGEIGATASAYQQQVWRQPWRQPARQDSKISARNLGFDVAFVFEEYLMVVRNTMITLSAWMQHSTLLYGGQLRAANHLRTLPSQPMHNMAIIELLKEGNGPFKANQIFEAKQKIGKKFAGAAVTILVAQRG